eukprot:m.515326 g.515326  ORF g.515326 m.515326 type:complete len:62 (-) comp21921_c0_seq19:329-514(-)
MQHDELECFTANASSPIAKGQNGFQIRIQDATLFHVDAAAGSASLYPKCEKQRGIAHHLQD